MVLMFVTSCTTQIVDFNENAVFPVIIIVVISSVIMICMVEIEVLSYVMGRGR